MKRALALALVAACGARTPLGATNEEAGTGAAASCTVEPTTPISCNAWAVAGAPQLVSSASNLGEGLDLTDAISIGCGAMVGWYTSSGPRAETLAWSTRVVGFDGIPRAPVATHPALTTSTGGSGELRLAWNRGRVGALLATALRCRFVPLDANGADAGAVVEHGALPCNGIAADDDGFSFLVPSAQVATPVTLMRVDAHGGARSTRTLATPPGRAIWNRLVFDDGSFLLDTFSEDPVTTVYADWLQHYDAQGAAMANEIVVGANTAPVLLAPTSRGVLAAWQWSTVHVVPLDRSARATGTEQTFGGQAPLYGVSLAPSPSGDVLLAWVDLRADSRFALHVQALAPDATPRGPTILAQDVIESSRVYGVVAPRGDRAILFFANAGVRALPLTCVR